MQNIILTLTLLICFSSYSQIAPPIPPKIPNNGSKFLECFCKENNFRQTFEINFQKEQIKRSSSINLETGEYFDGESYYRSNQEVNFVGDSKKGFIIGKKQKKDLSNLYVFDLDKLSYIQNSYYEDGSTFKQNYKCIWLFK